MPQNPARTFALVNIALFLGAIAVLLWLRTQGFLDDANDSEPLLPRSSASAAADTVSVGDVQPASAAQIRFIRELLTDTSDVVRQAMAVRAPRSEEAYYLGAKVGRADTADVPMALWIVTGPRDRPQSMRALNEAAEQYSVARPAPSAETAERAAKDAAQVLGERLNAASSEPARTGPTRPESSSE